MFPLGAVLFPSMVLPLHVFEPRYRASTRDCLAGDRRFGVVLIERGSEVGGGDVRFSVGTVAQIVEAAELPDGRFALGTVGVERIRVRVVARRRPLSARRSRGVGRPARRRTGSTPMHEENVVLLRRVLAMKAELGELAAPATIELSTDIVLAGLPSRGDRPARTRGPAGAAGGGVT